MDAIVTAGGVPGPGEPLYELTQGRSKALLEIEGRPMGQWVLDALSTSTQVGRVVITGLDAGSGLRCTHPLVFLPNQGSMMDNILAGVRKLFELDSATDRVMIVSSDVPAVTPQIIDWVAQSSLESEHDIYYSVITRAVMEARFPGSRRTYVHLKDMELCGGDVNVVRAGLALSDRGLWRQIIAERKNPLKQASLIGFDTLWMVLFRQFTLQAAAARAGERLGLRARAMLSPYAELGMDVDKPHQLEIIRADLARRRGA